MAPQLDLREQLELYAGVRPARLYHERHTPLKRYEAGQIDLVLVRESTEGMFASRLVPRDRSAEAEKTGLHLARPASTPANFACIFASARLNLSTSRLVRTGEMTITRPFVDASTARPGRASCIVRTESYRRTYARTRAARRPMPCRS